MRYDLGGVGGGGSHVTVNLHDEADIKANFLDLDSFCEDGSVEEFYLSHSLEHVPSQDYRQFLLGMLRKLKPGGCVRVVQTDVKRSLELYQRGEISFLAVRTVIFPPADRLRRNLYNQHFNMWGAEELAADFLAAGFSSVSVTDTGCWRLDTADELHPGAVEQFHHVRIPNLGIEAKKSVAISSPITPARIADLSQHERKFYSQNGEDGVTLRLLDLLRIREGFFLEICERSDSECNIRILKESPGFKGLILAQESSDPLHQGLATCEDIKETCDRLGVPRQAAVLSISLHGNEYWLWQAIASQVQAEIVIVRYNSALGPVEERVVPYDPGFRWSGTDYFGASISALTALGRTLGYRLVYADANGMHLFFVRDKILAQSGVQFLNADEPIRLFRPLCHAPEGRSYPPDVRQVPELPTPQLIPRIIHQTWKTAAIPPAFRPEWIESWTGLNPGWEYRFWTDEDIAAFVGDHYPAFYPLFAAYDVAIKRVDAFRYLLMKSIGGVYVDLDFVCLKPLDSLVHARELVIGSQLDGDWQRGHEHLCNAFLASMPGHPFWDGITVDLMRHASRYVLDATGPNFLTSRVQRALSFLDETSLPFIASKPLLYPFLWNDSRLGALREADPAHLATQYPDAFAATFWTATWK